MSRFALNRGLLVVAVCAIAGSVWLAGESQRRAADRAFAEIEAAHDLRTAMLDQETGLRGFALTRQRSFLEPYEQGRRRMESALIRAREVAHHADEFEAIDRQEAAIRQWQRLAEQALTVIALGRPISPGNVAARKGLMDHFRAVNQDFVTELRDEREREQRQAVYVTVALILSLSVLFAVIGYAFIERRGRLENRRRRRHADFKEALHIAKSEGEAYRVLTGYLESWIAGGQAVVLNRNNSADELEPRTPLPAGSRLRETLPGSEPDGCLAIRAGQVHARNAELPALLECEVCGAVGSPTTCVPSLVGGEVIGSVLVSHDRPLKSQERDEVRASVSEAAPVISNLRNVVIAEMRAVTDALTGLANNRAVQETAKRMAAQASRTLTPLAVVLFDLDHFKQINDAYGHSKGDDVLAAVGDAVAHTVRDSDFVGRYGGEEFVALLPDTDQQGAVQVAEKLREAISGVRVDELNGRLSASFGIAVMPEHAGEINALLRCADRALYVAKSNGRDRVEVFEAPVVGGTAESPPESS
jgi:diguanylate cyclase (GGDEF)-like protein